MSKNPHKIEKMGLQKSVITFLKSVSKASLKGNHKSLKRTTLSLTLHNYF